ncbi:1-acyl-sn-glycerol-3-phosphate acyltransferase 4 [Dionaea muscipula]
MEVGKPVEELKKRALTPFRVVRGLICLVVILSTAFMFLAYFSLVAAVFLRLYSVRCSRTVVSFLFGMWLALWPFLFEKINKTKVIFSGETVPGGEGRVLLIANHRTEVDWMYLWDLALRKGRLGSIKYILKSSLMKLPVFGWGFHIFEFIPVERKWEVDEPIMRQMLSTFTCPEDRLWLTLFPEGTDFTEQKCERSQKFAAENGFPVLNHVLLPKTKGFCACLETLRGTLDAVYDVTIAYKNKCPVIMDNVFGVNPMEVHIHVQRIPIAEIPESEDEAAAWLIDSFQRKDRLLADFTSQGHFPNQDTEAELSTFRCLVNFTLVIADRASATVFTVVNRCGHTIWPGTLCGNGKGVIGGGGFSLAPGQSVHLSAPVGWSGRIWARTSCTFNGSGAGKCVTGDCGGGIRCTGGGIPPATLVEFTLNGDGGKDFYDISLVDGYNIEVTVTPSGGSGNCQSAGCLRDLNPSCPAAMQVKDVTTGKVVACKSACLAFNRPEFCCTGAYGTPQTCPPTPYSQLFKSACPAAYSYAFDDASSLHTCTGANYLIAFC